MLALFVCLIPGFPTGSETAAKLLAAAEPLLHSVIKFVEVFKLLKEVLFLKVSFLLLLCQCVIANLNEAFSSINLSTPSSTHGELV